MTPEANGWAKLLSSITNPNSNPNQWRRSVVDFGWSGSVMSSHQTVSDASKKISFTFHFWQSLSSLMMWNLHFIQQQFWMKECGILRGRGENILWPLLRIFRGWGHDLSTPWSTPPDPNPNPYSKFFTMSGLWDGPNDSASKKVQIQIPFSDFGGSVSVHTIDIAPLRSESPPQKRSGMARVLKGFQFYLHTHTTRSSAIGMSQ